MRRRNFLLLTFFGLWIGPNLFALVYLNLEFRTPLLGTFLHMTLLLGVLPFIVLPSWGLAKLTGHPTTGHAVSGVFLASIQGFLLVFYGLSGIGLRSWGCWITWPIARAYLGHIAPLLAALGHSLTVVTLSLGLAWIILAYAYLKLLPALDRPFHPVVRALLVGLAILAAQSLLRDRAFWNANEPLEIARSAHRPFISQFPSMNDPVLSARESRAVSKYLATKPTLETPRPLILITVDAMRPDQMGLYGGPQNNTPFLSGLAEQGRLQRLAPAYSTSTWSYPGLLGVIGSKYPFQFTPQPWNLADVVKRLGYATYCFFSGDHTHFGDLRWMLGSNIDVYRDGASEADRYPNDDRLLPEWIANERWPKSQPVFLFLHLMSVHELGTLEPRFMRFENRYQNRILQADTRLQELFQIFDSNPAFHDALIIITADHGEFLGEFGHTAHGQEPYEAVAKVPLLIIDSLHPGAYPQRPLASLIDVAPTFLEAIGASIPPNWQGIPLQRTTDRNGIAIESTAVLSIVTVLNGRRYKYFRWHESGKESLFDLDAMVGTEESDLLKNLTGANRNILVQLRAQASRFRQ